MRTDILEEDFFTDPTKLPDPTMQLRFIAPAVVEIMAGIRSVNQVASIVCEEVYLMLRERAMLAARARRVTADTNKRPAVLIRNLRQSSPKPGVVEAVVLLSSAERTRAVTIRLEGRYNRWLATSIGII